MNFLYEFIYMPDNQGTIHNRKRLKWAVPRVFVIDLGDTYGKFDTWANEGGPGAGDRCTNPNNPNYNPTGWVCTNRGPS